MKKMILALFAIGFLGLSAHAEFFAGAKLGFGEYKSDMQSMYDGISATNKEIDKSSKALFGLEAGYMWALTDVDQLGFKIGFEGRGEEEVEATNYGPYEHRDATVNYFGMPISVQYKRLLGNKWALLANAGFTYGWANVEDEFSGVMSRKETKTEGKLFPFLSVGAEYRFTKLFALGADLKYNFGGKIKVDGGYFDDVKLADVSGLEFALAARFYFGK
ncbi:MAG: outer membrane beta-barrel protein [Elusimicrobiota bacterium]|nr:outer membrane beta-barrel protein [Elusimicrobiota bacterium]